MTKETAEFLLNIINGLGIKPADDDAAETVRKVAAAKKELLHVLKPVAK